LPFAFEVVVERLHPNLPSSRSTAKKILDIHRYIFSFRSSGFTVNAWRTMRRRWSVALPPRKSSASFRFCGIMVEEREYGEQVRAARLTTEQRHILHQLTLPTPAMILTKIHDPRQPKFFRDRSASQREPPCEM
jgi:hypothetical protein